MDTVNFEEELNKMTKPKVSLLKHQDMLSEAISRAKDKSVLSWWWLSIPVYMIAALMMKTFFMPGTTLISDIHELAEKNRYSSMLFFIVLPIFFILLNLFAIRKVRFLAGNPKTIDFLQVVWYNLLIIIASVIILLIYLL